MGINPMRPVAAAFVLLSVLVFCGCQAQSEKSPRTVVTDKTADSKPTDKKGEDKKEVKEESIADALVNGKWSMVIDLAPRFGGKKNDAFHDRPGEVTISEVKDNKIKGKYSYSPAIGKVNATLEGEISKDGKTIEVKFVEGGLIGGKGFGEFKVKRDDKTKKVVALEGWWKLQPIDPELKWYILRKEDKKKD